MIHGLLEQGSLVRRILGFVFSRWAILIIAVVLVVADFFRSTIVIQPIQVPKELADQGYSPEVIAKRLLDEVLLIKRGAHSARKAQRFDSQIDQIDVQVPVLGVQLRSVLSYLRGLVGAGDPQISGEIIKDKAGLRMRIRVGMPDAPYGEVIASDGKDRLDDLLHLGAEYIIRTMDPYTLASYYYDIDKSKSLDVIIYCFGHKDKSGIPWAYNLWGLIYLSDRKYNLAVEKFTKATDLFPDFAIAYANMADAYVEWSGADAEKANSYKETALGYYAKAFGILTNSGQPTGRNPRQLDFGAISDPNDQTAIGYMYAEGEGISGSRDYLNAQAVIWFRRAADQGYDVAEYNLGNHYLAGGRGVERDYDEAARLFRAAAEQGFAAAQSRLGYMFRKGLGVDQDNAAAVTWYQKAANQNNADAQRNLGDMLKEGLGSDPDVKAARNWYLAAAKQNDALAQESLGEIYEQGLGVPADPVQAFMWYRLAAGAGAGPGKAEEGLFRITQKMTKDDVNKAEKLAKDWRECHPI